MLNQKRNQGISTLDKQKSSKRVKQIPEDENEYENDSEDRRQRKRATEEAGEEENVSPEVFQVIIGHMNAVFGTRYRATAEATRRLIRGRMRDGFTKEDFFAVHLKKWTDWKDDPKMARYLRPETLYAAGKFEGYLNQITPAERSRMQSLVDQALARYGGQHDTRPGL